MKRILNIYIIAVVALSISSCSDSWLDTSPSSAVSSKNAFNTYDDVSVALSGAYDGVQGNSGNPTYYGARMIYYGDVRGDDMQSRTTGMRTSGCYEMNYIASNAPDIWGRPYDVIHRINEILQAIDEGKASDGAEADVKNLKGQALAIRALAHFDLVRVYGKPYAVSGAPASFGVPIINKIHPSSYCPTRNTVEEVYNQVITDLTTAIPLLKTAKSTGYFNQWAAKALLARVYLYKGDFTNAYSLATDIIANSPYKLWSNTEYVNAWNNAGTSEVILELINKDSDDWVDRESIGYLYAESGYADAILTESFVNLMSEDPSDVRMKLMANPTMATFNKEKFWGKPVFLNKYPGRSDYNPKDVRVNNVPVFRLSEIYLIAAEAAIRKSSPETTASAEYLNAIILRANPAATPVTSANVSLDRILKERRKELVGEGHRFFDAMRTNQTISRVGGWHVALIKDSEVFNNTYFRTILPIPQGEIDANPNIRSQQNPNY